MPHVSFAEGTPALRDTDLIRTNGHRRQLLEHLHAALRARVPGAEARTSEWRPPGDDGVPEDSAGVVSTVWGHMDKLRIMSKYLRLLHSMCQSHPRLAGHESACTGALEWFRPLCGPMAVPPPETLSRLQTLMYTLPSPVGEEAFHCHRHMVCSDRDMTRLLLAEHFPSSSEYEVDVCMEMLRDRGLSFDQWKDDFGRWREWGLAYPLAVAARAMPSLGYWLPREVHQYPLAQEFNAALARVRAEGVRDPVVLSGLCEAWGRDETHLGSLLGQTLDRLAVLMRVQSVNGSSQASRNLDEALEAFQAKHPVQGMHALNRSMWVSLAADVQEAFPPSLLCPLLAAQHRSSWGVPQLALETTEDGALGFRRTPLAWIDTSAWEFQHDRQVLEETLLNASAPGGPDEAYNCRIKDVLWRLGEVCTSPEVATCMLHPKGVLESIAGRQPQQALKAQASKLAQPAQASKLAAHPRDDEDFILSHMQGDMSHADTEPDYHRLTRTMDAAHPAQTVHRLREPVHLCMWRVDLPPRALVRELGSESGGKSSGFLDSELENDTIKTEDTSLHSARRHIINHKLATPTRGAVHAAAAPMRVGDLMDTVRRWTLTHWDTLLRSECIPHGGGRVTLTTLQEAVACFTGAPPPCVTKAPLGQSSSWDHPGIDARYAEHQEGANGFRYRDWVALHCSPTCTQQARLAAHCLSVKEWHVTQVPWLQADGSVVWVKTVATLPIVSRTMRGDSLRQAVESRYMHDPQLLSVPCEDDTLTRSNVELYETDGRVVIAYAPVGQCEKQPATLQMMAFQVVPNEPVKKNQVRWCDQVQP